MNIFELLGLEKKEKLQSSSLDEAHQDRNMLALAFAKVCIDSGYVVGIKEDPEENDNWPVLFIELPTGQVSWHIPRNELIGDISQYSGCWDGHTLKEKRDRLKDFIICDSKGIDKLILDFKNTFPGKCMICSYHRYGQRNGLISSTVEVEEHDCIE